jgi:alginate production protein
MAKRMGSLPFVAVIAGFACAIPAAAQTVSDPQDSKSNEGLFGDNRGPEDEEREFSIDGRLSLGIQHLDNDELDSSQTAQTSITPEARGDFTYRPDDDIEAYVSLEFGVDFDRDDGSWSTTERAELREAYLLVDDFVAKDIEFQIGRQDFEDGREWLYDERLDGVRLAYDHKDWRVEIGYGREELVPKDLFRGNPGREKVDNFVLHAEYEVTSDWDIAGYVLKQDDRRPSNVSPLFFGIQSEGKIGSNFGHWFEFSLQRGTSGTRKLRATALDIGAIYYLPADIKPAIFAGYARGSGGGNAATDRSFRQTGLQDNEDRITGLGNVKYYGELLDPDLSNIEIFTAGVGIRPSASSSLEIVAHKYRQAKLDDDDIRGSPISPDLNGNSKDIGTEVDAIMAVRLGGGLGMEAKLGWFKPGKAFDAPARDDAFFGKLRLVFRF